MANALTNPVSQIIAQLLIGLGQGSAVPTDPETELSDWPVYWGKEPSAPDNCITVTTTVGISDLRDMFGPLHQHYGFQVRIRAALAEVGEPKANEIRRSLAEDVNQRQVNVGSALTAYVIPCAARIGQVIALGRDTPQTAREIFTLNATAVIKPLS